MLKFVSRLIGNISLLGSDLSFLIKGGALALSIRGFGAGLALILNILIGRLLGVEGAGYYYMALAISSIGSVIVSLGMDHALLRFVAVNAAKGDLAKVSSVFFYGIRTVGVAGSIVAITLAIAAPLLTRRLFADQGLESPLFWITPSIATFALMMLISEGLKGVNRTVEAMLVSGVFYPLVALLLIFPLTSLMGSSGASLAYVLGTSVSVMLGLMLWRRAVGWHDCISQSEAAELWNVAPKLWVMSLINTALLPWLPLFLLGILNGAAAAGALGAATRLSMIVSFILAAAITIAAPKSAELLVKGDLRQLEKVMSQFSLIVLLLASPILIIMISSASELMGLFGNDFKNGGVALIIISTGQFFNVALGLNGYLLILSGHENRLKTGAIYSLFTLIVSCSILIPYLGLVGAAAAGTLAQVTTNVFNYVQVHSRLSLKIYPKWPG